MADNLKKMAGKMTESKINLMKKNHRKLKKK